MDNGYVVVYTGNMSQKPPVLNFVAPPELIAQLDEFRFSQRFESRAAAVKWLLTWALAKRPERGND